MCSSPGVGLLLLVLVYAFFKTRFWQGTLWVISLGVCVCVCVCVCVGLCVAFVCGFLQVIPHCFGNVSLEIAVVGVCVFCAIFL